MIQSRLSSTFHLIPHTPGTFAPQRHARHPKPPRGHLKSAFSRTSGVGSWLGSLSQGRDSYRESNRRHCRAGGPSRGCAPSRSEGTTRLVLEGFPVVHLNTLWMALHAP